MAAIVYQTSKQTGITYAYESLSYWDKEKRQSRAKRRCIGRVHPETKEIIPTRKRACAEDAGNHDDAHKRGPVPITDASRGFYGATYLFDAIGDKLGTTADLKKCFPDTYKQILSTAYYLILEDRNPLTVFLNGQPPINIPMRRTSLPRGAVNFLHPLPKTPKVISSDYRENAGWNRNTGHMTRRPYRAIPSA